MELGERLIVVSGLSQIGGSLGIVLFDADSFLVKNAKVLAGRCVPLYRSFFTPAGGLFRVCGNANAFLQHYREIVLRGCTAAFGRQSVPMSGGRYVFSGAHAVFEQPPEIVFP